MAALSIQSRAIQNLQTIASLAKPVSEAPATVQHVSDFDAKFKINAWGLKELNTQMRGAFDRDRTNLGAIAKLAGSPEMEHTFSPTQAGLLKDEVAAAQGEVAPEAFGKNPFSYDAAWQGNLSRAADHGSVIKSLVDGMLASLKKAVKL